MATPFSGVGSAPELLPEPVGAIGQLMPPGAGGNLLRSTRFFDGAAAGGHTAVLVAWTLAGLTVRLAAGARHRRLATERASIQLAGAWSRGDDAVKMLERRSRVLLAQETRRLRGGGSR